MQSAVLCKKILFVVSVVIIVSPVILIHEMCHSYAVWEVTTVKFLQSHLCSCCELHILCPGMVNLLALLFTLCTRDSVVCIVTRTGVDDSGFDSRQEQEIYLCSKTSLLALGSTCSSVQWASAAFPRV